MGDDEEAALRGMRLAVFVVADFGELTVSRVAVRSCSRDGGDNTIDSLSSVLSSSLSPALERKVRPFAFNFGALSAGRDLGVCVCVSDAVCAEQNSSTSSSMLFE